MNDDSISRQAAIDAVYERTRRIINHYPYIHLFGKWYLIRRYTYPAKRWSLWKLIRDKQ